MMTTERGIFFLVTGRIYENREKVQKEEEKYELATSART
jgi:hypothetical protein